MITQIWHQYTLKTGKPVAEKENIINKYERNTTVDLARIFAAFGVITLHIPCSTIESGFVNIFFWPISVSFFYVTSLSYYVSNFNQSSIYALYKKTWKRILIPYFAWTVIYAGLLVIKTWLLGKNTEIVLWRVLFYGESSVQLYFLPTLVLLQTIALAVFLIFSPNSLRQNLGLILFLMALCYLIWGDLNNCFGVADTGQIIGIVAYIASAFWLSTKTQTSAISHKYAFIGLLLIISSVCLNLLGYTLTVSAYSLIFPIGGIGLLLLAVSLPKNTLPNWISDLASASFGIYLSHVLFLEAFEFLLQITHINIYYDFAVKITETTLIFILAANFTFIIRKITLFRKLFLGE